MIFIYKFIYYHAVHKKFDPNTYYSLSIAKHLMDIAVSYRHLIYHYICIVYIL